jgi:hypothetical protein
MAEFLHSKKWCVCLKRDRAPTGSCRIEVCKISEVRNTFGKIRAHDGNIPAMLSPAKPESRTNMLPHRQPFQGVSIGEQY